MTTLPGALKWPLPVSTSITRSLPQQVQLTTGRALGGGTTTCLINCTSFTRRLLGCKKPKLRARLNWPIGSEAAIGDTWGKNTESLSEQGFQAISLKNERKTPLSSILVVGVAQWPQLAPNDFLGHREGIAAQQIDVFMNEG